MEELEKLLKAFADKNRLRILELLQRRKMCVCELAFVLGITQPAISKHLRKLSAAGIILSEQDHFWTNYYLRNDFKPLKILLSCFKKQLADDPVIKRDLKRLKIAKRTRICCQK